MGYTTDFYGWLEFNRKLTKDELKTYDKFKEQRHEDGYKQKPSIWLQWEVTDGTSTTHYLQWDGNEKFYSYIEWLKYIIKYMFKPWGLILNGKIQWRGEEFEDMGIIEVKDNKVSFTEFVRSGLTRGGEILDYKG
jgi:hypothetical protein